MQRRISKLSLNMQVCRRPPEDWLPAGWDEHRGPAGGDPLLRVAVPGPAHHPPPPLRRALHSPEQRRLFIHNSFVHDSKGILACGQIFKEILRNRLSLTWGWPEVLSMATIVQIFDSWFCPELFSLSLCISSEINEWDAAYFWVLTNSRPKDLIMN